MIAEPLAIKSRIRVSICAGDPISRDGLASQLRGSHGLELVGDGDPDPEQVVLVAVEEVDDEAARAIRAARRQGAEKILVIATRVDDAGLLAAVESGATGLLRRGDISRESLVSAIRATGAGDGCLPPDLLGRLLDQVGKLQRQVLQPRGLTFAGLTEREVKVLKLLADGLDTAEVGRQLFYSERTVKNIVQGVTSRFNLRNRTHAVAYALRQGLI
jgi:DNA-binding NarL/FixJ family response regulator